MPVPPEEQPKLNLVSGLNDLQEKIEPKSKIKKLALDTMSIEPDRYLWPQMLPLGELTVLAGEAGIGKTMLLLDIAAKVTTGNPFPTTSMHEAMPEGKVVYISAEDSWPKTLLPRFIASGGKTANLVAWDRTVSDGELLNLRTDLSDVEEELAKIDNLRLLILDPALAFVGDGFDNDNAVGVRRLLTELQDMAHRMGIAVIAMHHLTKDANRSMSARLLGSGAWTHLPRMVWGVIDHPEHGLMLGKLKTNCTSYEGVYRYELMPREIQGKEVYCAGWVDDLEDEFRYKKLQAFLGASPTATLHEQAKRALVEELEDGEWHYTQDVIKSVRDQTNVSAQTVQRIANEIQVDREREKEPHGKGRWKMALY